MNENEKKEILEIAEEIAFAIIGDVADNEDASSVAPIAKALYRAGYRKQSETVKEFAEKLKEKIEFLEQELIISCKQIEETDMLECDLFRTAREYGLYNIIDQLAKEHGVEEE